MRRWFSAAAVIVLMAGAAAGAEPLLLYSQNFNTCPATNDPSAGSSSCPNCNASLSNVTWKMWSYQNWCYQYLVRQVEDLGGGNMAVTIYDRADYAYPMTGRSLAAYAPAAGAWPAWQNVVVTAHQKWANNARAGSVDEYSTGLVLRGNPSTGTAGRDVWSGTFYLVQIWDVSSADSLRLIRVNNGVETAPNLPGVITWKNGYGNFDDAARREGYLRVDIQSLGIGGNVQLDATYSTDPAFTNPASVIIVGSWTDSDTNRILGGGTVGFAEKMIGMTQDGTKYFWDDIRVEKKQGGTVVWFR